MEMSEQQICKTLKCTPIFTWKKSILIIDDSEDNLMLNKTILEMENYEVFTALSGSDALFELTKISLPDLILLDMHMEDMSGTEFLILLEEKQPEFFANVPVVFLSAIDRPPVSKAAGFIRRPIDLDQFLAEVHQFIVSGTNLRYN